MLPLRGLIKIDFQPPLPPPPPQVVDIFLLPEAGLLSLEVLGALFLQSPTEHQISG